MPLKAELDLPDERNREIKIWINGVLLPRNEAKVSVFDSAVQGGDAVWEGIRVYNGRVFKLEEHLERLMRSSKAMAFENVPSKEEVREAVMTTLIENEMFDEAHIRLTLTRGVKVTSGMSPHFNQNGCTLIVLAEWKAPVYDRSGIRLITSSIRRNNPQCIDSKIHHNNLINNILAKIEANLAGVDDAIMLDLNGFVAETNATNIFIVKNGELHTPTADACLPGITRALVIELAGENDVRLVERNISASEVQTADEVFTTGSMGELSPVIEVDGRVVGNGGIGDLTLKMQRLFQAKTSLEGEPILRDQKIQYPDVEP